MSVSVENAQNHVDTNFGGSITLSLASGPSGAVLSGNLTVTAVNGVAKFSGLTINKRGSFTLQAESGGVSAPPVAITVVAGPPPRVTGIVGVAQSRKGLTSISIGFKEALNPKSADNSGLYQLLGDVKKGGKTVYNKSVAIKSIGYTSEGKTVTIYLAKPYEGAVQATVKAGLIGADGTASNQAFSVVAN